MTLSPAAQSAMQAALHHDPSGPTRHSVGAALRALADHQQAPITLGQPIDHWNPDDRTRRELRNLAVELEGATSADTALLIA